MRNLDMYNEDAFDFYLEVFSKKQNSKIDPEYKKRLKLLEGNMKPLYQAYDACVLGNTLTALRANGYTGQEKTDLLKMYSFNSSTMRKLLTKLTTTSNKRKIAFCQNCSVGEVGSFDHFVPKDEFPEFSVNPKNLFPSCAKCNSYKGAAWRDAGRSLFLNLYLDMLPNKQYLFVDIADGGGVVQVDYFLKNSEGVIDVALFEKIESHYDQLKLLSRFKDVSHKIITELENTIEINRVHSSCAEIMETVIETANKNRKYFGHNYYKSILEIALANDPDFVSRFG